MERPLGVTLVAILTSVWGILAVAGAFQGFAFTALILRSTGKRTDAVEMMTLAIVGSLMALLFIRATWGLLNLRKWARTVSILFAAIFFVSGFGGLIAGAVNKDWKYSEVSVLGTVVNLAALLYLLRSRVRDFFADPIKP